MKIIYSKDLAKQKKAKVDNDYFNEAKTLHIRKRGRGVVSFIFLIITIIGVCFIKQVSLNPQISDIYFTIYVSLLFLSFVISMFLFFSMCGIDDSAYHHPLIEYPIDVQFMLLAEKLNIKDITIKKRFAKLQMVVTGLTRDNKETEAYIEIPHHSRLISGKEDVIDLRDETYYSFLPLD